MIQASMRFPLFISGRGKTYEVSVKCCRRRKTVYDRRQVKRCCVKVSRTRRSNLIVILRLSYLSSFLVRFARGVRTACGMRYKVSPRAVVHRNSFHPNRFILHTLEAELRCSADNALGVAKRCYNETDRIAPR